MLKKIALLGVLTIGGAGAFGYFAAAQEQVAFAALDSCVRAQPPGS
jgi:hypothetical protein